MQTASMDPLLTMHAELGAQIKVDEQITQLLTVTRIQDRLLIFEPRPRFYCPHR